MKDNIGLPKYRLGQLVLYKTEAVTDECLDIGMIVGVNTMRGRVFGHYTYNIEWLKDANTVHKYVEEDIIDNWVEVYKSFRKQNNL